MRDAFRIRIVRAREILDSRGNPTVEVEVRLRGGATGRAAVPSGASTGTHEAVELRDGGARYLGKGVLKAVSHAAGPLARAVRGRDARDQEDIDRRLIRADGTPNKGRLGATAILGISLATARAAAAGSSLPLFAYLRAAFQLKLEGWRLPVPLMNVINGGVHADNPLDFQEFMIVPLGRPTFREALRAGVETFHHLKALLRGRGLSTAVGDEGGFAPRPATPESAMAFLLQAIRRAGYRPGKDVALALDVAATELSSDAGYRLTGLPGKPRKTSRQMVDWYDRLARRFPLVSIEDGLAEDDWDGWGLLTARLGRRIQLVGDDLFVTNPERLNRGIRDRVANAVLVKVNQIGTLTETVQVICRAQGAGYGVVISHRSGETEDDFISDLAVATNAGQIKTGSASRSDRLAKYNRLLRIEEELGRRARYPGRRALSR